jgi:type VI secretion system VgrG family protein
MMVLDNSKEARRMEAVSTNPVHFEFLSQAAARETFTVIGFDGSEDISRPYRFEIDLLADNPDLDLEALLYKPAFLAIEKDDRVRKLHGFIYECRLSGELPDHRYRYQVVLMPRIFLLSLSRQNQIYQNMTVSDILSEEITAGRARDATQHAKAGLFGDDFDLRLTRAYSNREYTVQYKESDLDFISRLMEHEGIFYFFEQGEEREKMIITDNNVHFAGADNEALSYRPSSGLALAGDEAMLAFAGTCRRVPRTVVLRDYNYRTAASMLQALGEVDECGQGVVCEYGDHFKTKEEGATLARIRSQELSCAKRTFTGASNSLALSPGRRFRLDEHFRKAFNAEYVVTALVHRGRQPVQSSAGHTRADSPHATYGNDLTCIPADVAYRPPRRTPRPVIPGLMNAKVDTAHLEERAELDTEGRYKLMMPFDISGAEAGKATRFVRKAQPYGGREMGMHFPLHKGTEVICSFANGDPDRPIIIGTVPNPETQSMVTAENHTRNVIKTASGVVLEINDGMPPPKSK